MAALNYAVQYSQALAQKFPYVLNFGDLYATPNNGRYRVTGAKTIEIPVISTTGRVDGDRNAITSISRNHNNSWETKVLTNHRKWDTLVHPVDVDQTNMAVSIANITQVFNEENKFPEMDAYTISKIYANWTGAPVSKTASTTVLTVDTVLTVFDTMMQAATEKRTPLQGRILYVTPTTDTLIKNAKAVSRFISNGEASISRVVSDIDMVKIVVVPSELMRTSYNFTVGAVPANGADQINMALIHPNAVITPVQYEFSQLDSPSATSQGKYVYYEESFEDTFILNQKADAIQFNITEIAPV